METGILLGRIGDADEVFLNGAKIGGEGIVGERFVEATSVERLYKIPQSLLVSGENLLAVRVMNTYLKGGIFESIIVIGDYNELLIAKMKLGNPIKRVEIILLTFYFLFILFCIFIYISGVHDMEYWTFSFFALLCAAMYLFDTLLFYETGLKTHTVQKIIFSLSALLPAALLIFLSGVYKERLRIYEKGIIVSSAAIAALFLISMNLKIYNLLASLWMLLAIVTVSRAVFSSVSAFRRKIPESGFFHVGIAVLSAGTVNWVLKFGGILTITDFYGYDHEVFFIPVTMLCFMYALVVRFSCALQNVKSFSERILTAHEEERKRLARELHDGLGQSLLTTKFNLQRMNQEKKERFIDGAIEELSGSINELRDISAALRPPFLEELGIPAALRMYSRRFSEKTGIKVYIEADLGQRASPLIEDNLFRIFQEALANAAKHSGAENVRVSLNRSKDKVIMEVKDDGRGFDYHRVRSEGRGIGLNTMEERVNLMEGNFFVKAAEGKGTVIRVEAALR